MVLNQTISGRARFCLRRTSRAEAKVGVAERQITDDRLQMTVEVPEQIRDDELQMTVAGDVWRDG